MCDIPARPHGLLLDNFSLQASSTIPDDFKKFKIETILKIPGHIAKTQQYGYGQRKEHVPEP
ncbi:hypothetical protein ATY37_10550 [Vibrio cidicii]|uniref:Uncharacterized protein n=1 Tax=Vibrio cidicii TaxID=1763883 RepID=A0A151L1S2_9VIBR|nr:hypothetical protein ATY37_10550 [Vibrio cidicii]